eukprot:CAMPEP_0179221284 /NCGR_PEP_ID=MMETSP0797-20121207/6104_1 /TAXON_ID=47934 /ORGANISM="Dinophysis acuminata, Strain DAEP01" /LENGTH=815 /DNA_ID=CAMNT_0020928047 /DNA_START=23 /DNA_END=2466 /DNA_ORIENTATION=-
MGFLSMPLNEEIMSCATWQDVLEHAAERCEKMDEVNLVTSFHRAAKLYRDEDGGHTTLEEVRARDGFRTLLEHLRHFVVRCRPQQLANSVWACAVLLSHDAALLQQICDHAVLRLGGYTTQNAANTVWALGTLGFPHEGFLEGLQLYVEANVRDFTPQDLANTLWAFAKLQRPCEGVYGAIVPESVLRLDTFQAQNMSNLVWACATVLYRDDAAFQTIAASASGRAGEFSTQELSNFTWGMATLGLSSEAWLEASGAEMVRRSRECCPQDLSNTIWAYGTLAHKRNEHLRAINWEVMRSIEWFSPQGLSNVTWGLSAIEYRDIKTLTCISEEVIRRPLEQMRPPDISTLLYSFAVLAWLHEGALAQLRRAVRFSLPVFATRDIANVSWAMVVLSHRDDGIFRSLMRRAADMMPDFSVQGLCNIAWAFVRFGLEVPAETSRGIAGETVRRRGELGAEPGDALLLSDAVCSEWASHVPRAILDECDAIGREQYNKVMAVLGDMANVPGLERAPGEVERYQRTITGLNIIQVGRRLTLELLRDLGMLEDSEGTAAELRTMRERWLLEELAKVDPTDATMQHKTTCGWALTAGGTTQVKEVLASGTAMQEEARFVPCVVEHPRASDAEFQVVNKAADRLLRGAGGAATLSLNVSEIPCLSCLGALRQFQKSFPAVALRVSFNIRKVADICTDRSADMDVEPPPSRKPKEPSLVPDNRGRAMPTVTGPSSMAAPPPGRNSVPLPRERAPSLSPLPKVPGQGVELPRGGDDDQELRGTCGGAQPSRPPAAECGAWRVWAEPADADHAGPPTGRGPSLPAAG